MRLISRLHRARRGAGFTLIEVMVALAILAMAIPALMSAMINMIDGAAHLRDRSVANWVALNQLTEQRLLVAARNQAPPTASKGIVEMVGREWYWASRAQKTDIEGLYRIDVSVAASKQAFDDAQMLTTVLGFAGVER